MRNFQEKKKWKKLMHSPASLGVLFVLVLFFAWNVLNFVVKMQETAKNKEISRNKVAELQKQKEKLSLDIEKLNTKDGVEETIRDKFGLVKEGEDVIVIVDEKEEKSDDGGQKDSGFFSFFKNLFK